MGDGLHRALASAVSRVGSCTGSGVEHAPPSLDYSFSPTEQQTERQEPGEDDGDGLEGPPLPPRPQTLRPCRATPAQSADYQPRVSTTPPTERSSRVFPESGPAASAFTRL